ncbi:MAG: ADP-ribosylglycohydrolase family protein, partial [Anaerolineae bacterium]
GIDGAAVQARAVAQAVQLDPEKPFPIEGFLQALLDTARTDQMAAKLTSVQDLVRERVPPQKAIGMLGQGVAVHESLPFALYSFARHPASFEDCLLCAVLHGGDRDTLGAMACAVSGAYLGVQAIPRAWRHKLENRETIRRLAVTLVEMWRD